MIGLRLIFPDQEALANRNLIKIFRRLFPFMTPGRVY
jgi:hypothetical protein